MRYNGDEDEKEFQRLTARSSRHVSAYKTKTDGRFVMVPLWWAQRVASIRHAPPKVLFVGIWLLHLKWKARSNTFPVPNGQLAIRGVNRKMKNRCLRQLEAAGLITVEWRAGKNPVVTLVIL
jgi:hypothetical protein